MTRSDKLKQLFEERIVIFDGAMGTAIQAYKLKEPDFRGERFADHSRDLKNFIDILSITQPAAIENIHRQYLEAGSDIIETNTFGATSVGMADFDLSDRVRELNLAAVELARRAVDEMNQRTPHKPRFVAGSIGPTTKAITELKMGHKGTSLAECCVQESRFYYEGQWYEISIYDRNKRQEGLVVPGPAIVGEMDSTTVILPGYEGCVDAVGNLLITPVTAGGQ